MVMSGGNLFDFDEAINKQIEEEARERKTVVGKIKYFIIDNENIIEGVLIGSAAALFGYVAGCRATANAVGKGLDAYNSLGFIRYFDKDGKEIFGEDAVRRAAEIAQNVRAK